MDNYVNFYYKRKNIKKLPCPYSKKSLEKIASHVRGDVLEIGVGDGNLSSILLSPNKINLYTGVDIHEKFLNDVKLKLQNKNFSQLKMLNKDFMTIEFDRQFDTILSFEVIEHMKSPDCFLKKIYNLLRPNGIAIISTPNKYIYSIVAKLVDGGKDPTHISEMDYKEFIEKFSKFFYILDSIYMLPIFPKLSFKLKSDTLWYFSELLGKRFKFLSLDVVLIGKK